ncbi:MAG: hypothetical protein U5L95_02460 [Candidatus Saccharibacteria bacterium]|nr:hypothetical protein [Candidatus Saccharibacteria bacterium]
MMTKTVYVCQNCNSDNVEVKAWVKPNRNNEYQEEIGEEVGWCCDEQLHAVIEAVELNEDAKVIGFQVFGEDGTTQEGLTHPLMEDSSSVYSLKQAHQMLTGNDDNQWQLLTIWDTDIENPR